MDTLKNKHFLMNIQGYSNLIAWGDEINLRRMVWNELDVSKKKAYCLQVKIFIEEKKRGK